MGQKATDLIGEAYNDNGGHGFGDLWDGVEKLVDAQLAEIARLKAEVESLRVAIGGYRDSNLASLATTLRARNEALEVEVERLRGPTSAPIEGGL